MQHTNQSNGHYICSSRAFMFRDHLRRMKLQSAVKQSQVETNRKCISWKYLEGLDKMWWHRIELGHLGYLSISVLMPSDRQLSKTRKPFLAWPELFYYMVSNTALQRQACILEIHIHFFHILKTKANNFHCNCHHSFI